MRRANQNNQRLIVKRRGKPQAFSMSLKDYINRIAPTPQWLKDIRADAKQRGTHRLSMRQINAEIAAVRRLQKRKI